MRITLRNSVLVLASLLSAGCLLLQKHDGLWQCHADADCEDGEHCSPRGSGQVCVVNGTCEGEGNVADCTDGLVCFQSRCVDPECNQDTQCGAYACDPQRYRCYKACSGFAINCADDASCVGGVCVHGTCTGTPPSCASNTTAAACGKESGCLYNQPCGGTPQSCSGFADQSTCYQQRGCIWSTDQLYGGSCYGTPYACADLAGTGGCATQAGCNFTAPGACRGTPYACDGIRQYAGCQTQPGCVWQTASH